MDVLVWPINVYSKKFCFIMMMPSILLWPKTLSRVVTYNSYFSDNSREMTKPESAFLALRDQRRETHFDAAELQCAAPRKYCKAERANKGIFAAGKTGLKRAWRNERSEILL